MDTLDLTDPQTYRDFLDSRIMSQGNLTPETWKELHDRLAKKPVLCFFPDYLDVGFIFRGPSIDKALGLPPDESAWLVPEKFRELILEKCPEIKIVPVTGKPPSSSSSA